MAALTWQTVAAANQSDAINLLNQGARSIQSGISGAANLANRLGQQEQAVFDKHKAAQTEQLLGQIAATTDRDEALALREQLNTDYLRSNYKDAIDVNQILSAAKARPDAIRQAMLNERKFTESEARRDFAAQLKLAMADLGGIKDPKLRSDSVATLLQDIQSNPSGTMADVQAVFQAAQLPQAAADTGTEVITPEQRLARQAQVIEAENQIAVQQDALNIAKQDPYSPENAAKLDQTTLANFGEWVNQNASDTDAFDSASIDSTDYLGGEDLVKFGKSVTSSDFTLNSRGEPVKAKPTDKDTFRIKPHHILNASKALVTKGAGTESGSNWLSGDAEVKADALLALAAQFATEEGAQRATAKGRQEELQKGVTSLKNELRRLQGTK